MTVQEVSKLIYVIKATYPQTFAKHTTRDLDNMIAAWAAVLEDYTYEQSSAGLKIYLASDTKGFPPSPGQVIDCIQKTMRTPELELNALEAWVLVRRAIRNSIYNAEEEYNRLPEAVQKAVGSPANLREMSQLDISRVETVEQSHFIRAYDATVQRMKDEAKIPQKILQLMRKPGGAIDADDTKRLAVNA